MFPPSSGSAVPTRDAHAVPRACRQGTTSTVHLFAAVLSALALALALSGGSPAPANGVTSGPAAEPDRHARSDSTNPLLGHPMGVYRGNAELSWPPYVRATGARKKLLAKIALRPKAKWFGAWIPDDEIAGKVRDYIGNATGGNPDVLVQMTVFRMVPWEHDACERLPTRAEQRSYRRWIDRFAAATGDAYAVIILQPDGPFALCVPRSSTLPSRLIAYAAKKLSALPHTSVYLDAGAADWPKDRPEESARFLLPAGIEHVRGFALNSTHYSPTSAEIDFGTRLVELLAELGAPGKHFVVNTSSNGRGFDFGTARGSHPDNANVCRTKAQTHCVTLGIPPTTDVDAARWGLTVKDRAAALEHVDAYLWFGRPWLFMQADPFSMFRALALARTTPF